MSNGFQVVFRVDASLRMGTGHVMRCLALADALRERGARCRFVSRAHTGHMGERIREAGHGLILLAAPGTDWTCKDAEPPHAAWLGAGWDVDAKQTVEVLEGEAVDWLVVDHYALDARWERALHGVANRLLVIDDLADRQHECDVLVDQNLGRSTNAYAGLVPAGCEILAGPRYALLRPEFAGLREQSLQRRRRPALKHVLVSMGGIDEQDATSEVLRGLHDSGLPATCRVTVVLGPQAPWVSSVTQALDDTGRPGEVLVGVSGMAELMAGCDLAIGAAGTTSWERCALGLPTILFALANNQIASAEALGKRGAAILAGGADGIREALPGAIAAFMEDGALERGSSGAAGITDGRGCGRVANLVAMYGLHDVDIQTRPVRASDLDDLRRWRNAPEIRAGMYSRLEIGEEEHRQWFQRCAADRSRHLLLVEQGGIPLGFVQFHETAAAVAEWGFYAATGAPKGSGTKLCRAALAHAFLNLGLYKINGQVIATNEKSAALHFKLGFTPEGRLRKQHFDGREYVDVLCFGLFASEFAQVE